jgi:hypothetical protein
MIKRKAGGRSDALSGSRFTGDISQRGKLIGELVWPADDKIADTQGWREKHRTAVVCGLRFKIDFNDQMFGERSRLVVASADAVDGQVYWTKVQYTDRCPTGRKIPEAAFG